MADQRVRTSTRLWSQEVAIAEAKTGEPPKPRGKEPGYEWSNGRKFDTGPGATTPAAWASGASDSIMEGRRAELMPR